MSIQTALQDDTSFIAQLDSFLESSEAQQYCLIAVDINHFKLLNEWYGWSTGDHILQLLAQRFAELATKLDGFAGYLGNDDFALALPDDDETIRRVRTDAQSLITFKDKALVFSVKIGVCSLTIFEEATAHDICNYAQIAAALENQTGKPYSRFDIKHLQEEREQLMVLSDIEEGLRKNQFTFYLQPQCNSASRTIIGMEALVRWVHPFRGIVSPGHFIPVLESAGIIVELDVVIWEQVCKMLGRWVKEGRNLVPVSINVSIADVQAIDVAQYLSSLCEKYHVPHKLLRVEITESMMAQNMTELMELTARLHDLGFIVLMDDFGSGYSSLNMLKDTNVDVIKLDMKLIELNNDNIEKGRQIVESVINMAHQIGLPVIAEGVENQSQIRMLRSLDCIYAQGFKFYKPMPIEHAEALLSQPGVEAYWDYSLDSENRNLKETHNQYAENLAGHICNLMSDYLILFGRVNIITGDFDLINRDPVFPAPKGGMTGNLQVYADRIVKEGFIAPEFIEEYKRRTNIERARSLIMSGSAHRLFTIRTTLGGDMEWMTIGFTAPDTCSPQNPWGVFFVRKESFTTLPAQVLGQSYEFDTLTGLFNREKYKNDTHEIPHLAFERITCVYLDVIGLHEVNNHIGHAAGDKMLSTIGEELRYRFPDASHYRLGGDEFLVIALDASFEEVSDKLALSINSLKAQDIDISFGIASTESVANNRELRNLVECAEQRMLENKREHYAVDGKQRQLRTLDRRLEDALQAKKDVEQSFTMILPNCTGVYVVNMLDDTMRIIRAPQTLQQYFIDSQESFTQAARRYTLEVVDPKYQSIVLDLLDYDVLRDYLWNGKQVTRYYENSDGTCFTLEIYPYSNKVAYKDYSLWVFTKVVEPDYSNR